MTDEEYYEAYPDEREEEYVEETSTINGGE